MKKRFFSFGCSFTKAWENPTWADFIGIEFENLYNFAMPGSSNNLIMQRFVEADSHYNFNKETDVIMIAISGLGRYSFPVTIGDEDFFYSRGDLDVSQSSAKDTREVSENFEFVRTKFWKKRFSVFDSYISLKVMKDILSARNIEHRILAGIDYKIYLDNAPVFGIGDNLLSKIEEMVGMLDVKESISEFDNFKDHHPSQQTHYNFVKKHLPQFLGAGSEKLLNINFDGKYYDYILNIHPGYQGLGAYDGSGSKAYCLGYF